MPRFFVPSLEPDRVTIAGEDAAHIARVLRARPGERLTLCDGAGTEAEGVLVSVAPDAVEADVAARRLSEAEPRLRLHLYQGFPKADKFELIVQKAVELGVYDITPVLTARCVSRPDEKARRVRVERANRIAAEAAKQAGRGRIPRVEPFVTLTEALAAAPRPAVFFYENGGAPVRTLLSDPPPGDLSLFIGPEGGFDAAELPGGDIPLATLGPRILRTETAPLAAIAAILCLAGEME